jgi:metalloendopeptidase OMA1, mitochondrial
MNLKRSPITLLVLPFLLFACGKDYITGKSSYNWFSLSTDIQLGAQVLEAQEKGFAGQKVPVDSEKDKEMLDRLKTIVGRVTKVSHIPDLPYEVHLADAPVVNAWAAPGGKIMVYEGLWDPQKGLVRKDSDDEIAAVLSHEIAHCTARHVTKALSQQMTLSLVGMVATSAIAGAGSAQGANLFGEMFSQGMDVYVPSYSRKNEAEADKIGLFYMAKAGYDPRAAIGVWRRAAQKRGDMTSIFASHPASGARAQALEKYLPEAMQIYEQVKDSSSSSSSPSPSPPPEPKVSKIKRKKT